MLKTVDDYISETVAMSLYDIICKILIKAHCQLNEVDCLGLLIPYDNVWPLSCWTDIRGEGVGV